MGFSESCFVSYNSAYVVFGCFFFFFSSRRRHTRCALVTGSSDVCSSDLLAILQIDPDLARLPQQRQQRLEPEALVVAQMPVGAAPRQADQLVARLSQRGITGPPAIAQAGIGQNGRASCRERVWQYV